MSARSYITRGISCDICEGQNCDGRNYEGDYWAEAERTLAEVRADAKEHGWTRRKGKDICPACIEQEVQE